MARRLCKWMYEAAGGRPTHVSIAAMLLLFVGMTAITGCSGSGSAPAKLTVTSMTPSSVYTTGGLVAFAGTNFTPNTTVTFGGGSTKQAKLHLKAKAIAALARHRHAVAVRITASTGAYRTSKTLR